MTSTYNRVTGAHQLQEAVDCTTTVGYSAGRTLPDAAESRPSQTRPPHRADHGILTRNTDCTAGGQRSSIVGRHPRQLNSINRGRNCRKVACTADIKTEVRQPGGDEIAGSTESKSAHRQEQVKYDMPRTSNPAGQTTGRAGCQPEQSGTETSGGGQQDTVRYGVYFSLFLFALLDHTYTRTTNRKSD